MAGIALGVYDKDEIFKQLKRKSFLPAMDMTERQKKCAGWQNAVNMAIK